MQHGSPSNDGERVVFRIALSRPPNLLGHEHHKAREHDESEHAQEVRGSMPSRRSEAPPQFDLAAFMVMFADL